MNAARPTLRRRAARAAGLLLAAAAATVLRAAQPPAEGHDAPPAAEPVAVAASPESATPDQVAQSLLSLAKRLAERQDREAAETAYHEALNSGAGAETLQQALLDYAQFLKQTGRPLRAAAAYEKFLDEYTLSPLVPSVMISLGRTLRDMGAYDQALSRFYAVLNRTIATGAGREEDYRGLAQLAKFEIADTFYQRGDYANAGKYFGRIRLLELPEEDRARAMFREAYAFYLNNQLEQAVPSLKAFIGRYPDDPSRQEAHYLLCLVLRKLNRLPEALEETLTLLRAARDATAADQDRWAYWQRKTGNQLANDFFEQGDITAALTIYQTLSQLRPEAAWRWPAVYQVGLCYERLKQAERAGAAYQSIVADAETAVKADGKLGPGEKEVLDMARWRLGQLDWAHRVDLGVQKYSLPGTARKPSDTQDLVSHP